MASLTERAQVVPLQSLAGIFGNRDTMIDHDRRFDPVEFLFAVLAQGMLIQEGDPKRSPLAVVATTGRTAARSINTLAALAFMDRTVALALSRDATLARGE